MWKQTYIPSSSRKSSNYASQASSQLGNTTTLPIVQLINLLMDIRSIPNAIRSRSPAHIATAESAILQCTVVQVTAREPTILNGGIREVAPRECGVRDPNITTRAAGDVAVADCGVVEGLSLHSLIPENIAILRARVVGNLGPVD